MDIHEDLSTTFGGYQAPTVADQNGGNAVRGLIRDLGIRSRVGAWLLLVGLTLSVGGITLLALTQAQLERSAHDSLRQLLELENNRIGAELADVRSDVGVLATDPLAVSLLDRDRPTATAGAEIDRLLVRTQRSGQDFTTLAVVDRDGAAVASTANADWDISDLVDAAMDQRSILVGPAYESGVLVLVAPLVSDAGEVRGALIVETKLTPIVWLAGSYESLGDTSEAFVFQRLADGSCQLLTDLRFQRSAAFSPLGGDLETECGDLPDGQLFEATDYRGAQTLNAMSRVAGTEWGVVVKMDTSEVFGLLGRLRLTVSASALVAGVILLIGWFALVRPIGSRLSRAADAAEQLAAGNFQAFIDDPRRDEIGRMSSSMDHLAHDLAVDIERREDAEARLRTRANTDDLTGLTNRRSMTARLTELTDGERDFSVIFLDLDGFKEINDTYGHTVGDEVLRLVSTRVQAIIDQDDLDAELARWGGDEFVVVVPEYLARGIAEFVDTVHRQFDEPFRTETGTHRVGVSIGTSDTSAGVELAEILSTADASMYEMKRRGDRRSRVSPKSIRFVDEALEQDRVLAHLQPLVSIDGESGVHLIGAEALVRIENEDGSLASPGSFLPGLGMSEQALALDYRVLERAARSAADWLARNVVPADFYVSANLGAAAMADPRLVEKVSSIIDCCGLSRQNLVVEIPETAKEVDIEQIDRLRDLGIRIAIDDVGCQFSNLERLVDIPGDIAKIDRRWLPDGDPEGPNKVELLEGLVEQCQMLDFVVVVEGVETDVQLDIIRRLGVRRVQGFLFGRPVGVDKFERLWARPDGHSLRAAAGEQQQSRVDDTVLLNNPLIQTPPRR